MFRRHEEVAAQHNLGYQSITVVLGETEPLDNPLAVLLTAKAADIRRLLETSGPGDGRAADLGHGGAREVHEFRTGVLSRKRLLFFGL